MTRPRRNRTAVRALSAALVAAVALAAAAPAAAQSAEERLRALEQEVAALKAALAEKKQADAEAAKAAEPATEPAADPRLDELERRLDLVAAELEKMKLGEAAIEADESHHGLGPAASKVYRKEQGVSIGGYGELLYQNFSGSTDAGAPSGKIDEIDMLRGIVYIGYKWNDQWLFNSELEWEHGSTGKGGEASVEFAYVDRLIRPEANVRAGLVLVPVGLVNELHEPTVFLGARRPGIESAILPSTWRESGVGLFGELGGFSYRTYLLNGLDAKGYTAGGIRGGRLSGFHGKAEEFAWVGRLDWTATPGLLAGGSLYYGGAGQGLVDPLDGSELDVTTRLVDLHLDWKWRGLQARALWADAELDDVAGLNRALALTGNKSVGEAMDGYYLEAGYDLFSHGEGEDRLVPFARWETYDTQAAVPAGYARNPASDVEQLTLGLQWYPFEQLVVKADWMDIDNGAGTGVDQFNVALGWVF
jgi:hypothetical protein